MGELTQQDLKDFLEKGDKLLTTIESRTDLMQEREASANQRIKLIQWITVVLLAPLLLTSSGNSIKNVKQMDKDELFEKFLTKERAWNYIRESYFMYKDINLNIVKNDSLIDTDNYHHRLMEQMLGDQSRGE